MTGDDIEIKTERTPVRPGPAAAGWVYRPRIDVTEEADEFTILADMPGAGTDDIMVHFEDRILTIHARVAPRQDRAVEFAVQEYGVGDFDRELVVPDEVDGDRVSAEYAHGVLTIHLPKSAGARPRRIPVRRA